MLVTALARLDAMWQFLRLTVDAQGKCLNDLVGFPVAQDDCWFGSQCLALKDGEDRPLAAAGWERAWHGTKLEAIYSIAFHGRLFCIRI